MPSYDAHPMAILTSAFAYLGSYYSEANPSLQGTPETRLTLREWAVSCCTMCYVRIARPNAVHKGRPNIARQYGQADIPTNWEGHDLGRVSSLSFRMSYMKCIHIFSGWPIASDKDVNSSRLPQASATLARTSASPALNSLF